MRLNTVPERSWQHILVDFIMKFPVSRSYNLILVICNRFLKMLYFITMTEKITVERLVKLFKDNI